MEGLVAVAVLNPVRKVEHIITDSAYATVFVVDKITVVGRDKRECRTHILRGVVQVLLKCGTILFLIFDIVLYIGFH